MKIHFFKENTRNSAVLASFVQYCQAHPELRFWQALANWSGIYFILGSNVPSFEVGLSHGEDTYYWEGRNQ